MVVVVVAGVVAALPLVANTTFQHLQLTVLMSLLAAAVAESCMVKTGGRAEQFVPVAGTEEMAQTE